MPQRLPQIVPTQLPQQLPQNLPQIKHEDVEMNSVLSPMINPYSGVPWLVPNHFIQTQQAFSLGEPINEAKTQRPGYLTYYQYPSSTLLPVDTSIYVQQTNNIVTSVNRSQASPPPADSPKTAFGSPIWTADDDKLLRHLKEEKKLGWREISVHFPKRTLNACQFRWRRLIAKEENKKKRDTMKKMLKKRLKLIGTDSAGGTGCHDVSESDQPAKKA